MYPPFTEHLPAELHVGKVTLGLHLVHANEKQLVNTAEGLDGLEKRRVKRRYFRVTTGGYVLSEHLVADRVQQSRHINAVGASRTAGMAGKTQPDALGFHYTVHVTQDRKAYKLMREEIHLRGHRATRRALAALITLMNH